MLIAFCGIDGSGKTTQIKLLAEKLKSENKKVYLTKQPTDFYRKYDRLPVFLNNTFSEEDKYIREELALLSAADKLRHYTLEIKSKLEMEFVITDRYVFSAYAYFIARGLDLEWLLDINRELPLPDLTICLDMDPEKAYVRVRKRDKENLNEEERNLERLRVVRNIFVQQPWGQRKEYIIIDADRLEHEISEEVYSYVEKILN